MANYLKKGNLVGVDGRLQTRNYDGQDGKRVYVTEVLAESVQFLEPRNGGGEQRGSFNQQPQELVSVTKALTHLVNPVIQVTKVIKVTLDLRRMTIHFRMLVNRLTFRTTIYHFNGVNRLFLTKNGGNRHGRTQRWTCEAS